MKNRKTLTIILSVIIFALVLGTGIFVISRVNQYEPLSYPVYGWANMRGENGIVYRGIGGVYGQEIPVEASTFAVRGEEIFYAGQIKEDHVVSAERTGTICKAKLDGSESEVLVEDAYNLGYGQEKLIGDKIFYTTGLDEEFNLTYAWYDLDDGSKGDIKSSRINNIFGYDGTCIFYGGYDAKNSRNIVGSYHIEKGKDKILFSYGAAGEEGDIISLYYYEGRIYAVTMIKEMENYDARTAEYQFIARSAKNGKVVEELPLILTGSANYGFLYSGNQIYYSTAEAICTAQLPQNEKEELKGSSEDKALSTTVLAPLKETEYWGIPHFAPGDGYLYYEAIADINEETGMNDYFYRISLEGGEPELLASWFIS